jgi:hypothetical protein
MEAATVKTILILVILCCAVFMSAQVPEEAFYESGNAFVRFCTAADRVSDMKNSTDSDVQHTLNCSLYVLGIVHAVEFEVAYSEKMTGKKPSQPFCVPDNVENGQMVKVVLKYIRAHPGEAHRHAGLLVMSALGEAYPYPCPAS